MNKRKFQWFLVTVLLILFFMLLWVIPFYFVGSIDNFDESIGYKYCKVAANDRGKEEVIIHNDFMYNKQKYYSCIIGDAIPKLYIFDNDGDIYTYVNYNKVKNIADTLKGKTSIGLYENKVVIIEKIIEDDNLDIYYYNLNGDLIFDMRGLKQDEETTVVE